MAFIFQHGPGASGDTVLTPDSVQDAAGFLCLSVRKRRRCEMPILVLAARGPFHTENSRPLALGCLFLISFVSVLLKSLLF